MGNNFKDTMDVVNDYVEPKTKKELCKTVFTLSRTINVALSPLSLLIWGYEKIEKTINANLERKLKNVPEEDIVTPDPRVAGPLIESLKFTAQEDELREMYTNLLASSMNKTKNNEVHPSYVEIIKQLLPDEAKLIKEISNSNGGTHGLLGIRVLVEGGNSGTTYVSKFCKFYDSKSIENKFKIPLYLENLERLKLIEIPNGKSLTNKEVHYKPLENHRLITKELEELSAKGEKTKFENEYLQLTEFGKSFVKVCI